jgi:ubiquinone/menaquinone biosynthesis C-methylase UbiE
MMTLLVVFFSIVILLMMSVFLYMITIKRTSAKVMVMDDVRKTISKGSSILDFGAGNGVIRDELVKYGYSVVSIDVEGASSHPQIRTYDGHRIPYEDNTFDACLCIYVLHHIPHHASILYELRRVC